MEVKFLTDELKLLYQTGSSKKYKTVPMQVAKKLVRAVDVLSAATVIQDVWKFPSYRFEHLQGNNRYSMRMDRTWRLEMEIEWTNNECTIGIIGLYDLT
ncbi:MAG: type II toxin-antitoxin system RelE/ParE family toxin, partial [Spirochaetia bacterium]|nr:type II toxin-antitoxin system RelE/ParE family toxin [Spirochaetia bacterium]